MTSDLRSISLFRLVQEIKKRPKMFFENLSLTDLDLFISGYNMNSKAAETRPFSYFNIWVKQKFKMFGPQMNWKRAILEEYKNDEEKSFWSFFDLLDEFHKLKPTNIYTTKLTPDHFASYYSKDNKKPSTSHGGEVFFINPAPYFIKVVEFDYQTHAYHFDFFYAINETLSGHYDQGHDSIKDCFEYYKDMYGELVWQEVLQDELIPEYELIMFNCDHRRACVH
jgi:hypothetical protein